MANDAIVLPISHTIEADDIPSILGPLIAIKNNYGIVTYIVKSSMSTPRNIADEIWHREDGPALCWGDPSSITSIGWVWRGHSYVFDEWLKVNTVLSDEEKLMLKLQYGS